MVLETIEVMDNIDEFNKLLKSYFDDMAKHLMQGLELMSSQLKGKMEARGSNSSHHGKKNKIISFE